MTRFGFSIIFLMLLTGFLLAGQRPVLADSTGYRFDSWTSGSALPQNSVYSILQTSDGYLWITTLDGLVRYDGVRFKVFNKINSKGIRSNRFTRLVEDRDKNLWICTEDSGLTRYRDGAFTTFTTEDGLPDNWIYGLRQTEGGELLVRTSKGLARWQDGRFVVLSTDLNSFDSALGYQGRSGALYYRLETTLRRVKDGEVTEYTVPEFSGDDQDRPQLYEDRRGRLWIGTWQQGLYMLEGGTLTRYTTEDGLPSYWVRAFCEDREGVLWLGTPGGGLVRFQDGRFTTYTTRDGLPANHIATIYEDREGTLWAGTSSNGLFRINKQIIKAYLPKGELERKSLYPMIEDRAGNLWMGGDGLFRYKDGTFSYYPPTLDSKTQRVSEPHSIIMGLYEDRDGRIWIGAQDKLISYKDHLFTDESAMLGDSRPWADINVIHRDGQGTLWFGTRDGLIEHKDGKSRYYGTEEGLPDLEIHALLEDRQGALWVGTYGGLVRYHNSQFTSYTESDGLSSNRVRSLYEDREGALWIGTYDGGLDRFKDGRFTRYTTDDGLFSNGVFQILEDDAGNFWMSSNQGIYRVSHRQLNDFAEGKLTRLTSISYGVRDGMRNSECNGGRQPAGFRARDGRLWFPTLNGVVSVDPKGVSSNPLPPPVLIESVLLNRKDIAFNRGMEIPAGQQTLEIQYTGLSLIRSEAIRFRYKIEGLDADWVEAGNRRTAFYSYIPAGEYTFRVIAANADGVWNEEGATISIIVIPPFYQTLWFQGLVIILFLGIVALIYRLRIENLKRAREAQEAFSRRVVSSQEAERKRIAAELHDGLGQSLLVIKNRALIGADLSDSGSSAVEQFKEIESVVSEAITETKKIAYNLRPLHLDRFGLSSALEDMIEKVDSASGIRFSSRIAPLDGLVPKEYEIDLYRVIQESINNIVKHSQASEALIIVDHRGDTLSITIKDDGKGFDDNPETSLFNRRAGLGIASIGERIRLLGGSLEIDSYPRRGTTLKITLPLKGRTDGQS
ncbi:MAG: histidine kinase [Blastocatellia bacterium]|nr:histidine kinase [Blastocatellia bacterium]